MSGDNTQNFYQTQINQLKNMTGYAYTSEGKSMFYAGEGNWQRASEYAEMHNMNPVTQTRPGEILDTVVTREQSSINRDDKKAIWRSASRSYAAQVEGNVKTFVAGANPDSIFRKTELSTILNNEKVETINGLERTEIDQQRRQTFQRLTQQGVEPRQAAGQANDSAHRKVAIQEIRQDLQKAEEQKDQALKEDAQERLEALRLQNKKEVQQAQQLKLNEERQEEIEQDFDHASEEIEKAQQSEPNEEYQNEIEKDEAVQKYGAERYEKIEQQNFEKLTSQGVKAEYAQKAAQDRVSHVQEKLILNAQREKLQQKGEQLQAKEALAYQEKLRDFQNRRIQDLKDQAQQQGMDYKGPPQQDPSLSEKSDEANARAFKQQTHLKAAFNEGRFKENEFEKRSINIERNRNNMIERSMAHNLGGIEQNKDLEQNQSHSLGH